MFVTGAQIVDMMMLVVDISKGMQTQTAECLVIGDITCNKMVVVLNKVDLISQEKRESAIEKVICISLIFLSGTKFFILKILRSKIPHKSSLNYNFKLSDEKEVMEDLGKHKVCRQ